MACSSTYIIGIQSDSNYTVYIRQKSAINTIFRISLNVFQTKLNLTFINIRIKE